MGNSTRATLQLNCTGTSGSGNIALLQLTTTSSGGPAYLDFNQGSNNWVLGANTDGTFQLGLSNALGSPSINLSNAALLTLGASGFSGTNVLQGNWNVTGTFTYQASIRTVTTSTSISSTDEVMLVNQSGPVTMTLPVPVAGKIFEIKDLNGTAASHNITIAHHASELIDGQTTKVLNVNYQSVRVISDGTNWSIL